MFIVIFPKINRNFFTGKVLFWQKTLIIKYFLAFFHLKTYWKRCFRTIMMNYFCCKTILCIIYALVCFCTTFGEYFEPERYFFKEKCQQLGFFSQRFTPRLSDFGPIQAVRIIPTIQMSQYEYDEWLCEVEIWIHSV